MFTSSYFPPVFFADIYFPPGVYILTGDLYQDFTFYHEWFQYKGHSSVPGSTSLPDNWSMENGTFTTKYGFSLIAEEPGEMVWNGDNFHDILSSMTQSTVEESNFSLSFLFKPVTDLKFEIRGRRSSLNYYVSLNIDIENELIQLTETMGGTSNILDSRSFKWNTGTTPPGYIAELWMYESRIEGYINGGLFLEGASNLNLDEPGFSLYVPEVWSEDLPNFYLFYARSIAKSPTPQLDPNNLFVQERNKIKTACENPGTWSWDSFKDARWAYERGKDYGFSDEKWREYGYPIREPLYELWYQNID